MSMYFLFICYLLLYINGEIVKDDTLGIPNMYQLVIDEINHSHAPYDPAVKDTLNAILEKFLSKEMNVLAFYNHIKLSNIGFIGDLQK